MEKRRILLSQIYFFLRLSIFAGCLALLWWLQSKKLTTLQSPSQQSEQEFTTNQQLESRLLSVTEKLPSFGFSNLLGKWTFLKFLQYFGDDQARSVNGYGLSSRYFQIIINNDPWFIDSYPFLYAGVSLFSGQPETSIALMEKGLSSMSPQNPPKGFMLWKFKSLDELLFFGDLDASHNSLTNAYNWASQSSLPNKNFYSQSYRETIHFLEAQPDIQWIKVYSWLSVLPYIVDPKVQTQIFSEVEKLGGQIIENPDGSFSLQLDE